MNGFIRLRFATFASSMALVIFPAALNAGYDGVAELAVAVVPRLVRLHHHCLLACISALEQDNYPASLDDTHGLFRGGGYWVNEERR